MNDLEIMKEFGELKGRVSALRGLVEIEERDDKKYATLSAATIRAVFGWKKAEDDTE